MSSVECATEPGPAFNEAPVARSDSDPAAKLRTRVFFGFGSAMALGLSLAGWYVGGRILAAEQTPAVSTSTPVTVSSAVSVPAPEPVQKTSPPPEPVPQVQAPPAPQLFLEVAGLGVKQDALFMKKLRARGLPALIDSGTDHQARRILIGPFADRQAVDKAQRKLQAFGVLALERAY